MLLVTGCARAPRAGPLTGVQVARRLPPTPLAPGYRRVLFQWEYRERIGSARGQGVVRIAPPDSIRIDLFLENGSFGGFVILIADSITSVAQDEARRSLPPAPMLWAALGVVRITGADTAVVMDGDTLRADVGHDPSWRVTFGPTALVRLERFVGGRIEEPVERTETTQVLYRQPAAGRSLVLALRQVVRETGFDASIWRP
jgi:hypothetical protein